MDKKTELEIIERFAAQLSLNRVKTEGLYFDRDYRRQDTDGQMRLVAEKAVVVTHGKTTKVIIGEGEAYQTFEEAVAGVKAHWSEYFRRRRQMVKTEAARVGERRRQRQYRQRRKDKLAEFKHRQ